MYLHTLYLTRKADSPNGSQTRDSSPQCYPLTHCKACIALLTQKVNLINMAIKQTPHSYVVFPGQASNRMYATMGTYAVCLLLLHIMQLRLPPLSPHAASHWVNVHCIITHFYYKLQGCRLLSRIVCQSQGTLIRKLKLFTGSCSKETSPWHLPNHGSKAVSSCRLLNWCCFH